MLFMVDNGFSSLSFERFFKVVIVKTCGQNNAKVLMVKYLWGL